MRERSIYETLYIVNSFNAVDAATKQTIQADETGMIAPSPGTVIIFPNPQDTLDRNRYVDLNTLTIKTGDTPVKIQINDNELYPFYVEANSMKGIQYIRIYSIKFLSGGGFYYEGLSSES